jgi:CelD/BcsL family acetyltransferase involved in cellulose biosynthesis
MAASNIAGVLDAELIGDLAELRELSPEWDRLAVLAKSPLSSPAWMLGWLHHVAPKTASPRVIAVREGSQLVGLAPLFVDEHAQRRVDYRLLGNALPRALPLALPGREREVARALAATLAEASPRADLLALECTCPDWGSRLREAWPGHVAPLMFSYLTMSSPIVPLREPSFEQWLAGKSSNFRSQMRRLRRQLAERGGVARTSTVETLSADIAAFCSLHADRWEGRGPSSIVAQGEGFRSMLAAIGAEHVESGRMRLWMLEAEGQPISAQLFAAAGGEVVYYNGGWDERFAKLKPAMLGILAAVEQAFANGEERVDLGPGAQPYKLRFADGDDPLTWTILMPPGRRLPLTAARLAPMLVKEATRRAAKRRLSDEQVERLRGVKRAVGTIRPR